MENNFIEQDDGSTPLTNDELQQLKIKYITTQGELNEYEQLNINEALRWLVFQKITPQKIMNFTFVKKLHKQMFGNVWIWAGEFRKTEKNISVDQLFISTQLKNLLEDTLTQIHYQSYQPREIAARFHHRLVWIHPFVNGNGRHARVMTDLLLQAMGQKSFSWGQHGLTQYKDHNQNRKEYINALCEADKGNMESLIKFVDS